MKDIANCKLQIENCKLAHASSPRPAVMKEIANCKLKIENCKVAHGSIPRSSQFAICNLQFAICNSPSRRRGFTLVELLVVIAIIAMLAGAVMGALARTQEVARADATKATVAKLHALVMRREESYASRRIPMNLNATLKQGQQAYAALRKQVLRDLMRMEMPERWCDITTGPLVAGLPQPSLQHLYQTKYNANKPGASSDHQQAKCLYLWVTTSIPEAKTMFSTKEVAPNLDGDNWPMFIDGWGNPIGFLRWAPGATTWSDVQIDDTASTNFHHDPFDPNFIEPTAYHLYPLIFAGVLSKVNGFDDYGIALGNGAVPNDCTITAPTLDPYSAPYVGSGATPSVGAVLPAGSVPLIHNQHMEQK
jgi:prepilin-type N-terminal cleavage/methylation domain-containing protein